MPSHAIEHYRKRNEDAPLDLVRESERWQPVVRLIDGWAKEKLSSTSGYSSQELDHFARLHSIRFPTVVREWWRLAGRHPFVQMSLLQDNAMFLKPSDEGLLSRPNFLAITIDDTQTWSGNGIHFDFLAKEEPEVHGINGVIESGNDPSLSWYKGQFIATGLNVPTLIYTTLLYHLCEPSPLVLDEAAYLNVERHGLRAGQPDERLLSQLKLERFPNNTLVGDIYSDNQDIIYWWLRGFSCRTTEAAERVRRITAT